MRMRLLALSAAIGAAATLLASSPARADVIDGNWCLTEGKRLTIQGPSIVTPTGAHLEGNYSRHFFSYVAPPSDPGAGLLVSLRLLNEETMQSSTGPVQSQGASDQSPVLTWHRCGPPTS